MSLLVRIVEDILLFGPDNQVGDVVGKIKARFTLGTISKGPVLLRFYGHNVTQHGGYSVTIDGDDKLDVLAAHCIRRVRRRDLESRLNDVKQKALASINGAVGWLGITALLFCATFLSFFNNMLQTETFLTYAEELLD